MDVHQRKAVEIILNSDKISRQQQTIDSFIRWQMVNFIKVNFQASLSKRKGVVERVPYF